ncbi:Restriction of telomere capping protein 5 [Frankliniella fusca]|uniref:Restriction of telomere capping protein 5 n=1 Tax=Frankliniella fusca TaxID=407009 RepID=A0AAE1HTY9_9NEOP|nr:Restriction of telomere capping protein 5 [Frankliniella fusca]
MGNHHSHSDNHSSSSSRKSISRTSSGADIKEQNHATALVPVDKLAKILVHKTADEGIGQNVISASVFAKYLFPQYPELGLKVFNYMARCGGGCKSTKQMSASSFRQQADKLLQIIPDEKIAELYVKVFSEGSEEVAQQQVLDLLMLTYRLAMDNYPGGPQTCLHIHHTLQAVVDSAFHKKLAVSPGYMSNWLLQHLPRLLPLLHRYVVHVLTTAYRSLQEKQPVTTSAPGMELSTPVLEKNFDIDTKGPYLLPVSQVWLLATSLPAIYTMPSQHPNGSSSPTQHNGSCAQSLIAKMLGSTYPSHWAPLYSSDQHGLGSNRFLHHVLSYRGPTLTFLRGQEGVEFCLAADSEWHESNHYWGCENSCVLQILPLFHVIERGAKLLYLNFSIRGYPKGIHAGKNPSKPSLKLDDAFSMITYSGIPYPLVSVEVWGCGTSKSREQQLETKKWEVKQAEKQRVVKLSAAEWADHPDRYLLELGGRQTYNTPSN